MAQLQLIEDMTLGGCGGHGLGKRLVGSRCFLFILPYYSLSLSNEVSCPPISITIYYLLYFNYHTILFLVIVPFIYDVLSCFPQYFL